MKRFVAFLCCFLLLCSTCYAEVDFNVSDYTNEELAEIYSIVSDKLYGCIVVPAGYYVVGKDLPAGKYTILDNSDMPGEDPEYAHVAVFRNMDDYNVEGVKHSTWWFNDEHINIGACNTLWGGMTVELSDGMVIVVAIGNAGIRKVQTGIFDALWN